MSGDADTSNLDMARAELFDALGHPTRIRILHALEDAPLGFSELKRRSGLDSSGHLQFHLGKLDGLIRTSPDGAYSLSDDGREALRVVGFKDSPSAKNDLPKRRDSVTVGRAALVGAIATMIFVAALASAAYVRLDMQFDAQRQEIAALNNVIAQLNITSYPAYSNTCSDGPSPSLVGSDVTQATNGLSLTASLNATITQYGQVIQITMVATNTLNQPLKVFTSTTSLMTGVDSYASGLIGFPMGIALYSGYLDCFNASSSEPLSIYPVRIQSCLSSGCPSLDYVMFQPNSDDASAGWSLPFPTYWTSHSMVLTALMGSYYAIVTTNGTYPYPYPGPAVYPFQGYLQDGTPYHVALQSLPPGNYTVVAGTAWGHSLFLHFLVQ